MLELVAIYSYGLEIFLSSSFCSMWTLVVNQNASHGSSLIKFKSISAPGLRCVNDFEVSLNIHPGAIRNYKMYLSSTLQSKVNGGM